MSASRRILLVDDLAMFRDLGALFLARSGRVQLAASAADAFEIAAQRPPDVVISDMHLPDLAGTELCRLFKTVEANEDGPPARPPFVVLLARPDSRADHAAAVRAGADDVLFKPLERDELVGAVRRLTDYATPRGLPRAEIEQPVEITARGTRVEGRLVNVSRGGLFARVPAHFNQSEEVAVSFRLGGSEAVISPTAQVIWSDPTGTDDEACVGLRFLEIDSVTISMLDHYVSDHFPRDLSVPL